MMYIGYLAILTVTLLTGQSLSALFKWFALKRIGVSKEDRTAIFSDRKHNFNLEQLFKKHDEKKIRILDSLSRKGAHLFTGSIYMVIVQVVIRNTEHIFISIIVQALLNVIFFLIAFRSNRIIGLGGSFYGGLARIRDGIYGRLNILLANVSLAVQYLIVALISIGLILPLLHGDQSKYLLLINFIYFPLVLGDASGELIGGTWGKQKIKVWGVGEINKKSRLGTSAVFFSSFIAITAHVFLQGLPPTFIILAFIISLVSTIIELFSPRSMDNVMIPVANALLCVGWIALFGM